jgi:hypothetical protein
MSRFRIFAALAAALLVPASAPAAVLVTIDGATIETRGPWKVQGRQVVFTLPNGTLSSLRAETVDLDASAQATARAAEAATAPPVTETPAPLGEPVLRITEADIPPSPEATEGEEGEGAPAAGGAAAAPTVPLEVVSWDKVPIDDGDGVQIFGTVRNSGSETVIGPALSVSVYGAEGGLLALTDAEVNLSAIPAGKTANFRAEFPGLPDFAAVRFIPSGRGYEGRPPAGSVEEGGEEAAAEEPPVELEAELEPEAEPEAVEEGEEPPPHG